MAEIEMKFPIGKADFSRFISDTKIFEKTKEAMNTCLTRWYQEAPHHFVGDMGADLETVLKTHRFHEEGVSISRSYATVYDMPLDYISCRITITDQEDGICATYTAFFDEHLRLFDDKIS